VRGCCGCRSWVVAGRSSRCLRWARILARPYFAASWSADEGWMRVTSTVDLVDIEFKLRSNAYSPSSILTSGSAIIKIKISKFQ
jgi:hypothetical protein